MIFVIGGTVGTALTETEVGTTATGGVGTAEGVGAKVLQARPVVNNSNATSERRNEEERMDTQNPPSGHHAE